jgi:hypothetical protein
MVSFWALEKQEADTEEINPCIASKKVKTRIEVGCMISDSSGCSLDSGNAC